ncbi:MAG: threonine synthase [Chitinophagaceae bacterium]|nr:MAG: threonine synthase [Chitinophagaceae bacterium]
MQYYSLKKQSALVDFKTAAITGQAPDKGLYFPTHIPSLDAATIQRFKTLPKEQLAFEVMRPYVGGAIDDKSLQQICKETISFNFPSVSITEQIDSLELFHGPTLAFKDVGARFMSRCLGYFAKQNLLEQSKHQINDAKNTTVLVATSGDTGGAVAKGFLGVEGVSVIILYPKGKVSPIQELQLTTCGQNITALEVDGSFDDCQAIVKEAFMDVALNEKYNLTSANSINVARWLPQQLYYFFAWQDWVAKYGEEVTMNVVVPSGNFGNICAGMMAKASGLPIGQFVAACNANDVVTRYLSTQKYDVKKAVATISNAMDVGDPSNFVRIMEIMRQNFQQLSAQLISYQISDSDTKSTIAGVYKTCNYTLDPHGAVAFIAAEKFIKEQELTASPPSSIRALILETAHPVKFPEVVEKAIGQSIPIPASVAYLLNREKVSIPLSATYAAFKEWMMH